MIFSVKSLSQNANVTNNLRHNSLFAYKITCENPITKIFYGKIRSDTKIFYGEKRPDTKILRCLDRVI